jgi:hypothetical protein
MANNNAVNLSFEEFKKIDWPFRFPQVIIDVIEHLTSKNIK